MAPESGHPVRHPLVKLARIAVETYVTSHVLLAAPYPLSEEQQQRSGVFVTLTLGQDLRGSIGTLRPLQPNLALEVIYNAVAAAVRDPRFSPVASHELPDLGYVVDLVEQLERVASLQAFDPASYGLAISAGRRLGVVLPQTSGVKDADAQLKLAARKGGIALDEPYQLQRFCVQRLQ